jgi:hypothetical protein
MNGLLVSAGFEIVTAPDQKQADLRRTLRDFAAKAAEKGPDTVVLVYYAGHGLQVDGENFLVPTDARIQRETDVPMETVRLTDVMNALASAPSKTRIVILDACRNNPFSEIRATTGRGLAIVDAPTGSIVSYSTAPGTEALDGDGQNSPFTKALIEVAKEPGLPIEQALKRVRLAVHQSTSGQQTPWESSSLTADFAFFPGAGGAIASTQPGASPIQVSTGGGALGAARAAQIKSVQQWRSELQPRGAQQAYEIVIREDAVEAYEAFVAIYGNSPLAPRVRSLFDRRREMVAWYTAVTLNTIESFRAFLDQFPNSDLAATARRLQERARTRSALASLAPVRISAVPPAACTCPEPQRTIPPPTRASITPAPDVVVPPVVTPPRIRVVVPPKKKKEKEKPVKQTKRHDPTPPPRRGVKPPTDAEIFGPGRGPSAAPPVSISIGVGFVGGRRGGGHHVPQRHPTPAHIPQRRH